eukprot:14867-Heterococcus_DN1.PRE.2
MSLLCIAMLQQGTQDLQQYKIYVDELEKVLFALPDNNSDGLIDKREFDAYMQQYMRDHPEIEPSELPSFRDMDDNGNGKITLAEWRAYMEQMAEAYDM